MRQIITSPLDSDLYKFSMLQVYYHYENATTATFVFACRNKDVKFTKEMYDEICQQIEHLTFLRYMSDELGYLAKLGWFKDNFLRFLSGFRLEAMDVKTSLNDGNMEIRITAPIVSATMYEVYVLAIVSEVYHYYKMKEYNQDVKTLHSEGMKRLEAKAKRINEIEGLPFTDFGTRRRFSKEWQAIVVEYLAQNCKGFVGTSNVYLAKQLGLKPIGTMAHEYIMSCQALTSLDRSEKMAMERWLKFYEGNLGTALTDTLTTDHFLKIFNGTLARAFTGVRQDSGDPIAWGYKMIAHYEKLGIDPKTKSFIFSDSLNLELMIKIWLEFKGKALVSFGIGTNLTNDLGVIPLNIIIKMMECQGFPLIKTSDTAGKIMCENEKYKEFVMDYLNIKVA